MSSVTFLFSTFSLPQKVFIYSRWRILRLEIADIQAIGVKGEKKDGFDFEKLNFFIYLGFTSSDLL